MRHAPRLFAHVRVIAALLPLAGCIALVDAFEVRDHCGIEGSSACASCIQTSCQAAIDVVCRSGAPAAESSASSASLLDDVDRCGRGQAISCEIALSRERSSVEEEVLRACVRSSCMAACTTRAGDAEEPRWTCDAPRTDPSPCGQCVHRSCAAKLDDCCADETCADERDFQLDLGVCLKGDPRACVWSFTDASADGTSGIVRQCMIDSCYEACFGDGLPHTSCTPRASGTYCTCRSAAESSGPECSASAMGVDYCVRGRRGCTCGAFQLASTTSTTCTVDYLAGPSKHSDSACVPHSEGRCCLSVEETGISCECDTSEFARECTSSQYTIYECSEDAIKALIGALAVPSCSR